MEKMNVSFRGDLGMLNRRKGGGEKEEGVLTLERALLLLGRLHKREGGHTRLQTRIRSIAILALETHSSIYQVSGGREEKECEVPPPLSRLQT